MGITGKITKRCSCTQSPLLKDTGWSEPHPQWYCRVCKKEYWPDGKGGITTERPAKWPEAKRITEKWELKDGNWRKTK